MEVEIYNRCLLCYSQFNCSEVILKNCTQIHFYRTLHNILELDDGPYIDEINIQNNCCVFCKTCEDKMECIANTLRQVELLQLKLKSFRKNIEDDILCSYNLQAQVCSRSETRWESNLNSSALREKLVRDLNTKKNMHSSLESVANENVLESIQKELFDQKFEPSTIDIELPEDDFIESGTGESPMSFLEETDIFTHGKEIQIRVERIDDIYPFLRSTFRVSLKTGTIVPKEIDDIFNFSPPENLLDMSYYSFPTKCLAPGCKRIEEFADKVKLWKHIRCVHIKNNITTHPSYDPFDILSYPASCPESDCVNTTVFADKANLLLHMKDVHWGEQNQLSKLSVNLNSYTKFPTKCKEKSCKCKVVFTEKYKLVRHIRSVHILKVKDPILDSCTYPTRCPILGCKIKRFFPERCRLRRHLRDMHVPDQKRDLWEGIVYPAKCPQVGCKNPSIFSDQNKLKRHVQDTHLISQSTDLQKFQCEHCGQLCKTPKSLNVHSRIHTGETLVCEDCGSQFRTEGGLRNHRKVHHAEVEPVYPCTLCPKTFKISSGLQIHLQRHAGVRKELCQLCPSSFLFKWELRDHQRYVHADELNLKKSDCKICGKHFSNPRVLRQHMVQHTGKARYNCDRCTYKTSQLHDFKEHVDTVHSSNFGFKCNECGKQFKLERRLRSHMLGHIDNYEFECQECQQRFLNAKTLRTHIKRKHPQCPTEPNRLELCQDEGEMDFAVTEHVDHLQC